MLKINRTMPFFLIYSQYFSKAPGGPQQTIIVGLIGNGATPESLSLNSNWPVAVADKYGIQPVFIWPTTEKN